MCLNLIQQISILYVNTDRIDMTPRQKCYKMLLVGGVIASATLIGVGAGMGLPVVIIMGVVVLTALAGAVILYRR